MKIRTLALCLVGTATAAAEAANHHEVTPLFDYKQYCVNVGQAAGGSYRIEQSCRKREESSRGLIVLDLPGIPDRIFSYCKDVGSAAGGSYSIMRGCIKRELEAKQQMGR